MQTLNPPPRRQPSRAAAITPAIRPRAGQAAVLTLSLLLMLARRSRRHNARHFTA